MRLDDDPPPSRPAEAPIVVWAIAAVLVIALFVLALGLLR